MGQGNTGAGKAGGPVDIGSRRELFVDRLLVEKMTGATLRLQVPCRQPRPRSPLVGGYMTVIHDGRLYRGYYRAYKPGFKGEKKDGNRGECTCYAESRDGNEWVHPELDLVKEDVFGRVGNAVFDESPFAHNFSPFLDSRPGVPADERYKALAGTRESGLYAFASADGRRWRHLGREPVLVHDRARHLGNAFDSQNVCFWSPAEARYLCFFRHWKTAVGGPRTVGRAASADFRTWRDESDVFQPPNLPGEELYTNQTHPYFRAPHIYIALPTRFTHGLVGGQPVVDEAGKTRNIGSTDIMFMSLRAGADAYQRLFHEAFIRPGPDPAGWENRANYLALNVVPAGPAQMAVYNRDGHRWLLRTDGFTAVNAPAAGGELLTRPLLFAGDRLELNLATSTRGEVKVELQDGDGRPLPGFSLDDCTPFTGDTIGHFVSWRGRGLGRVAGQPARLRFVMRDADLYSLRFC